MTPPSPVRDRRNLVLLAAFLGWMFDGLEMGIFPLVARPALQQMQSNSHIVDDKFIGQWTAIITALFLLGAAGGGLLFGWIADRVGRTRAMTIAILCYSLFTTATYLVQQPWQLGLVRFIAALGMGGEWAVGIALVMEVWPERHRPILAGTIGAAGNLGFALLAIIGTFFAVTVESWRYVALVGAAPALLTFFIRLFVPESDRWQRAAALRPPRPIREILASRALRRPLILTVVLSAVALIGTWGSVQWLPLWADQMAGAALPTAKAQTALSSALGSVVGCFFGAWLGRFGRRAAYFLLCVGSLLSCAWLFRGVDHYGTLFLALTFVVGALTASFYGLLPLYLPELFPTRVRATAQGAGFNAGRILAAFGALYAGVLMQRFNGSYARAGAVITLIYLVGIVAIWFARETRDEPLPE